jgi:hypothetical protein
MAASESHHAQNVRERRHSGAAPSDARSSARSSEWCDLDVELVLDASADQTITADELAAIERLLGVDLDAFLNSGR